MPNDEIAEILKFDPGRPVAGTPQTGQRDEIAEILEFDPKRTEGQGPQGIEIPRRRGGVTGSFAVKPWGEALLEGFSNIPGSFVENLKLMITPLVHPVQTAKALGTLGAGIAEKVIPGEQKHEPAVDMLVDHLEERYGSVEGLKKTIAEDPVGVLVDVASVVYPAGKGVQVAGKAAQMPRLAAAGATIAKAGVAMEPVNVLARGAAAPVRIGLKAFPQVPSKLYQSAAKFSTALSKEQRAKITFTALDNQIAPNWKGIHKVRDMIDDLNTNITAQIDAVAQTGKKIPVESVFKNYGKLYDTASLTGKPLEARRILDRIKKNILEANKQLRRETFTPQQIQQLKQNIYRDLESYYSSVKESPIAVKAQKAIAKAAKESLEELIPEIKQLNAREGALIELRDAIERSANRITNRDLLGIGVPIKGVMGGVVGDLPGLAGGIALGLMDTPKVKAKLAIVLQRLKDKGIKVRETPTVIRLGLYETGSVLEND